MELIERHEELGRLRQAFQHVQNGVGQTILVTGAVASGKTALLHAFAEQVLAQGGHFLESAGSRAERGLRFGIIEQLFHAARLTPDGNTRVRQLLLDPIFSADLGDPGGETPPALRAGDQSRALILQELFATLVQVSDQRPLVLAVDDMHHADTASLRCLLYIARRVRSARVLLVMTEPVRPQPAHPLFRAELFSQPHYTRIVLKPLTASGVALLATSRHSQTTAQRLAEPWHALSGGNPLLARALVEDQPRDDIPEPRPRLGESFTQAVLGSLYRHENTVREVARGLAVLAQPSIATRSLPQPQPELLAQLVAVVPESASQAIRILDISGLTRQGRFRHNRIAQTIHDDIPLHNRRDLHAHAAELLQDDGAPATAVAEHLLAAGFATAPWTIPVLHAAAEQALASGQTDLAGSCLRLAMQHGSDQRQLAVTTALLVQAQWQTNPIAASAHLSKLVDAARTDQLSPDELLTAVPYLLWNGSVDDAHEVLHRVRKAKDTISLETLARLQTMSMLGAAAYPARLSHPTIPKPYSSPNTASSRTISQPLQAIAQLAGVNATTSKEDLAAEAEGLLKRRELNGSALGPMTAAVTTLLYCGHAARAAHWGDLLLRRVSQSSGPVWAALLRAVRAEASLRMGDLSAAEEHAKAALNSIPPKAWGVAIGVPLATLFLAATETGNLDDAARRLTTPVPQVMFDTPFGLHYLHARGRYYLAIGRHNAAVSDFQTCGELMGKWDVDLPTLAPWRLELARVHQRMGRIAQASELAREQLHSRHGNDDRTRGAVLRLIASTTPLEDRPALLAEAAELLENSGDRIELAHAMSDLGQTLRAIGETAKARATIRKAYQIGRECGAELLCRQLVLAEPAAEASETPAPPAGDDPDDRLSDAERRVAILAAKGHTNREIARKLYVTVSTVEQHLTRVYRKLSVKRRADLPATLATLVTGRYEDLRMDAFS